MILRSVFRQGFRRCRFQKEMRSCFVLLWDIRRFVLPSNNSSSFVLLTFVGTCWAGPPFEVVLVRSWSNIHLDRSSVPLLIYRRPLSALSLYTGDVSSILKREYSFFSSQSRGCASSTKALLGWRDEWPSQLRRRRFPHGGVESQMVAKLLPRLVFLLIELTHRPSVSRTGPSSLTR